MGDTKMVNLSQTFRRTRHLWSKNRTRRSLKCHGNWQSERVRSFVCPTGWPRKEKLEEGTAKPREWLQLVDLYRAAWRPICGPTTWLLNVLLAHGTCWEIYSQTQSIGPNQHTSSALPLHHHDHRPTKTATHLAITFGLHWRCPHWRKV